MDSGISPQETFLGTQQRRRLRYCSKIILSHPPPVTGWRPLGPFALMVLQQPRRQEEPDHDQEEAGRGLLCAWCFYRTVK